MELRTNILIKRIKEAYFLPKSELKKFLIKTLEDNLNLIEENNNFKNDYLYTENQMLKDKNKELDNLCFKLTQENGLEGRYIKELESENLTLIKENLILKSDIGNITLENKELRNYIEQLETDKDFLWKANINMPYAVLESESHEQQEEINERLNMDKPLEEDYYNTKDLDKKMVADALEKTSSERDTYKEVIKTIIDKYNISDDEILNIIDDIQINKSQQIEKTL